MGSIYEYYFIEFIEGMFINEYYLDEQNMNHKLLFLTELIFSSNPKANGKILLGFYQGNQADWYRESTAYLRVLCKDEGTVHST